MDVGASSSIKEGDGTEAGKDVGWMRPIAAQADFHVARWTRSHRDREHSQPSDEDPVVRASSPAPSPRTDLVS